MNHLPAGVPETPITPQAQATKQACATNFKLVIPDDIYQKIAYWLRKTPNEVSGFGSLDWNEKESTFTVKDVILLKQDVGRASTEIDPNALGKAMFQMKDEPLGLKWHWHTHPNMGVFWSGDDMEIIRSLGQRGWIIATVFNEKGQHKSAFYTSAEVMGRPHDIFRDDLPTEVCRFLPREFFNALDAEYEACVTEQKYAPAYPGNWVGPGTHTKTGRYYDDEGELIHRGTDHHRPLTYSPMGYTEVEGDWIYNPLHDDELKTEEARLDMIAEMAPYEVEYLKRVDNRFLALYTRYVLRDADTKTAEDEVGLWNT